MVTDLVPVTTITLKCATDTVTIVAVSTAVLEALSSSLDTDPLL